MQLKIIKTEAEYKAALAKVDSLMSARPGTPEGDLLELWAYLVEAYENEHHPILPPNPLEAIRFRMEQEALQPADLVPYFGSKSKVSEVLSGKRALSIAMIRKLHEGLGIPAEVLLGRSKRPTSPSALQIDWREFPLAEMSRRRWFGDKITTSKELAEQAEELLIPYLMFQSGPQSHAVHLRQSLSRGTKVEENAIWAWQARVLHLAEQQRVDLYRDSAITKQLIGETARLSQLNQGPLIAREMLAKAGIRLVIERQMPHTRLDGAAMRIGNNPPIIALTLRYDRLDNFWFTLCHELAHVVLHLGRGRAEQFLDDLEAEGQSQEEKQANKAALDGMIPQNEWNAFRAQRKHTRSDIISFASSFRLHPAIVAGRFRKDTRNYTIFSELLGNRKVRSLFHA